MKNVFSKVLLSAGSVALVIGAGNAAKAGIVYEAGSSPGAFQGYKSVANGNGLFGYGDDYNTGSSGNISLNGLSFTGGFNSANPGDTLSIDFYNTSGGFVSSVTVPASQVPLSYSYLGNTLPASDFGSGITIPGSGYFFFAPSNPSGSQATFTLAYGTGAPVAGGSGVGGFDIQDDGVTVAPVTETGFAFVNGVPASVPEPYASVALSVPEPASLGLLASGLLLLQRRRRSA